MISRAAFKRAAAILLLAALLSGCVSCVRNDPAPQEAIATDKPVDVTATDVPTPEPLLTEEPSYSASPTLWPPIPSVTDVPPTDEPFVTPEPTGEISDTQAPETPAPATPVPGPQTPAPSTPTPEPVPTDVPAPTPEPTPGPTPDPNAEITFSENSSLPLPSLREDLPRGNSFCFGGFVRCNNPILRVRAVISSGSGTVLSGEVTFSAADGKTSVELVDRTFPKNASDNHSLTAKIDFRTLSTGTYTFRLYAEAVGVPETLLASSQFKVTSTEWNKLIANNLRNSYSYALSFFGSRDEFMFSYKWKASTGRDIIVESGWDAAHITSVTSPSGGKWYVHTKAVPYYERAIGYLNNTYVRVHGTNGDSGVIKLSSLIKSFDGTLNHRFVTDRSFISHHAFGAAIDLNASLDANVNSLSNRNLIKDEVKNKLEYNGIREHNGVRYYDFTYSGSHSSEYREVPTTVINYLLYELAFYRAGFNWGYYYDHTCDAMHFGLSEFSSSVHNTSSRSLRKVMEYIG